MKASTKCLLLTCAVACIILASTSPASAPVINDTGSLDLISLNSSNGANASLYFRDPGQPEAGYRLNISTGSTDRLNRTVTFTIDARDMKNREGWQNITLDYCILNITYPDGTPRTFDMGDPSPANLFTLAIITNTTMRPGSYWNVTVSQFIPNITAPFTPAFTLVGSESFGTPAFEVVNIAPWGILQVNSTSIPRNHSISFNMTLFDAETPFINLRWGLGMFKDSVRRATWQTGDEFHQVYNFNGTGDELLGNYQFILNVTDGDGLTKVMSPLNFSVVNVVPVIHAVTYNHTTDLLRVRDSLFFTVNTTDYEDGNISSTRVWVYLQNIINHHNVTIKELTFNTTTTNHTGTVTFPDTARFGEPHRIVVMARDRNGGPVYWTATDMVHPDNNVPVINGIRVNNATIASGARFSQNQVITFSLNVSDVEGDLNFVQLMLVHSATGNFLQFHATLIQGTPLNSTTFLIPVNVSTAMMETGTWDVYVFVNDFDSFDTDNQSGNFNAFGTVEILPDLQDLTFLVFSTVLAMIIGFVIGGGLLWRYANSRIKDIRREMLIKGSSGKVEKKKDQGTGGYQEPTGAAEPAPKPEGTPSKQPQPAKAGGSKKQPKTRF